MNIPSAIATMPGLGTTLEKLPSCSAVKRPPDRQKSRFTWHFHHLNGDETPGQSCYAAKGTTERVRYTDPDVTIGAKTTNRRKRASNEGIWNCGDAGQLLVC